MTPPPLARLAFKIGMGKTRDDGMKTFYRSVWISDIHLCSKESQAQVLYTFLDSIKCDYLYLVGDVIDVWALRNRWYWPRQYNEVVHKLLKRSRKGARVIYIPGNHDEFFRDFAEYKFGDVEIQLEAIHTTADNKRFLVLHGDAYDTIVRFRPWLSHLGCWASAYLIAVNRWINAVRRFFGRPAWSFSASVKRKVQNAVKHLTDFEDVVVKVAHRRCVDGVICGHTHEPALHESDGVMYCNTGDWVDNCTALVEHTDGRIELLWWREELEKRQVEVEPRAKQDASNGRSGLIVPGGLIARLRPSADKSCSPVESPPGSGE